MIDPPPRVVAVVGPSGVGKDSLIAALAAADPRLVPLRRAITRPADATEPFRPVTDAEFDAMAARGAFVLTWGAHGLRYGVPRAGIAALGPGETGLANLSRGVLEAAARVLPRLAVLSVTAPAGVLASRLAGRGREDAAAIAARLARPAPSPPDGLPTVTLDNGGALAATVAAARRWLDQVPA